MDGSKRNKSQSKYYHTACLMNEALLQLLEKKDYAFLSVKEICEKAGVNRSTFYLHYETMDDLLTETIQYIGKKIADQYNREHVIDKTRIQTCPVEELLLVSPKYLYPYLNFVKDNKKIFQTAFVQPRALKTQEISGYLYDEIFEPIMARFGIPENERKYRIAFGLNGMGAVIIEWVRGGCKEEVGDIADILIKCFHIHGTDGGAKA